MTRHTPPPSSVLRADPDAPVVVGLSNPGDVVSSVPALLGYRPTHSVVLILLGGPRRRVELTMRVDLPEGGDPRRWVRVGAALVPGATASGADEAILVLIDADMATGREAANHLGPVLVDLGISLADALVVFDERYASVLCSDPECCPTEGRLVPGGSAVAAAAVVTGRVIRDTRDELGAEIAPPDRSQSAASDRVATRLAASIQHGRIDLSIEAVDERLDRACATTPEDDLRLEQAVELALMVAAGEIRDQAYLHLLDAGAERHRAVWAAVCRQVPERLSVVPLVLFALSAYLLGDGAVANVALDRALQLDERHPSVRLLGDLLAAGIPPAAIRAALTRCVVDED